MHFVREQSQERRVGFEDRLGFISRHTSKINTIEISHHWVRIVVNHAASLPMESLARRRANSSQEQLEDLTEPGQHPNSTLPQPTLPNKMYPEGTTPPPNGSVSHPLKHPVRTHLLPQSNQSLYSPISQSQYARQHTGRPSQMTNPASLAHRQRQLELRKRVCMSWGALSHAAPDTTCNADANVSVDTTCNADANVSAENELYI